jgi:hypothetical protein
MVKKPLRQDLIFSLAVNWDVLCEKIISLLNHPNGVNYRN